MKRRVFTAIAMLLTACCWGQYTINGNASRNDCHCYTLTSNSFTQSGSVWNNNKIDLSQSFDYNFDIFLGCDDNGADGIVFVLQPISTSVGGSGGGLGFQGISPSIGVTIDTWQNTEVNDPTFDHIAIQSNGNLDHASTATNLAGPVTTLPGIDNIEDCRWHTLRVKWEATAKTLTAYVDGQQRVSATKDLVADIFGGNPLVFWGFTGSTGGARNLQQFCTALRPKFYLQPSQKRCINEPVQFFDSTISFAPVSKLYWDFGDGSDIDSVNQNPVHTYTSAGDYTVTLRALGADGCAENNPQVIRIGSYPVAKFGADSGCINAPLLFTDSSTVTIGTINQWNWNLGAAGAATDINPSATYVLDGPQIITLSVKTVEGCESAPVSKTALVFPLPVVDFDISGTLCRNSNVLFTNRSTIGSGYSIGSLTYTFGNGQQSQQPVASTTYNAAQDYTVVLQAVSNNGCTAGKTKTLTILPSPVPAIKYSLSGCLPVSAVFSDTSAITGGAAINNWQWDFANGALSQLSNPSANYNADGAYTVKLVTRNANGCFSDTARATFIVPAKPKAVFGYSALLCSSDPISLFDSSKVANGTIGGWQWLVDGAVISSQQLPAPVLFLPGPHRIQLLVTNNTGCVSDTATTLINIRSGPAIAANTHDGCVNTLLYFGATNTTADAVSWQWSFGDNSNAAVKDTTHLYTSPGVYSAIVTAADISGCTTSDTTAIKVYSTQASAGADTIIASVNQPVQLNATGGVLYEWTPPEGLNDPVSPNPVAINDETVRYRLRAYTPVGCDTYDEVLIRIFDGPQLYVPSAFSPNADGRNDWFRIWTPGVIKLNYFSVYNRFGQLLFTTTDPAKGWDGNFKGTAQPPGTYVWIASGTTFRGTNLFRKGTVVLIR